MATNSWRERSRAVSIVDRIMKLLLGEDDARRKAGTDRCATHALYRRPRCRRRRAAARDRLCGERLPRHHGGRGRGRDPGIHLSQPRTAQGAHPAHHRLCRWTRAGHGRNFASLLQDRDRAGAFAESLGAAAVQLLAPLRPFAGPPTHADLLAYFEAVARESKLPIALYLNPGPGADVAIADTIALAKLPRVELLKESSRDLARVSRLIVEIDRAGHARYFTTMQMLLATLELGGSGATMPPPGCEIARHVIDAFVAKDFERAAEIQRQFALFPAKWMHRGLAPVMKAAMNLIGVPVGDPYPPYASLNADEIAALAALLRTTALAKRFSVTAAA